MNKGRAVLISAILVAIVLLLAAGLVYSQTSRKTPPKEPGKSASRLLKGPRKIAPYGLVMKEVDLPTLVKDSEIILRGKVIEVLPSAVGPKPKIMRESEAKEAVKRGETNIEVVRDDISQEELEQLARERRGFIYTDKIIKVEKYYKNPLQTDTIIVRELGGQVGERKEGGFDLTPLEVDDEVLLFLSKGWLSTAGDNRYWITVALQGKYYIKGDQVIREDSQVSKKLTEFEAEIMSLVGQQ